MANDSLLFIVLFGPVGLALGVWGFAGMISNYRERNDPDRIFYETWFG